MPRIEVTRFGSPVREFIEVFNHGMTESEYTNAQLDLINSLSRETEEAQAIRVLGEDYFA